MAVDVKTLRIGSHVEYEGKRVRVALVRDDGCICEYKDNGQDVIVGLGVEKKPIPITPALLKELGVEEDKTDVVKRVGGYYIYFHQINNLSWRVSLDEENYTNYGDCIVRYLHEAEAFLALHGVELIEELV